MSLFNQLGNAQHAPNAQPNAQAGVGTNPNAQPTPEQLQKIQQSVHDVKADPAAYLQQNFGVNVPQGVSDPMQIMNHLAQSGQLNAAQMRAYQGMRRMMGRR